MYASAAGPLSHLQIPKCLAASFTALVIFLEFAGGYSLGDTKALAKSLPASVKRYFGMEVPH